MVDFNGIIEHFEYVIKTTYYQYPSCIPFFVFFWIIFYFAVIRWMLVPRFVERIQRTKKEEKLYRKQREQRTRRQKWIDFGRWILCVGYEPQQLKRGFFAARTCNYIWLAILPAYAFLTICAIWVKPLQFWCVVASRLMNWLLALAMAVYVNAYLIHKIKQNPKGASSFLIIFICIGLPFLNSARNYTYLGTGYDVYMFLDISECQQLQENAFPEAVTTIYTNPKKEDREWHKQEYLSFFGAEYETETLWFELYAYEFADEEVAKSYYHSAASRTAYGPLDFQRKAKNNAVFLTVIENTKVYHIQTDKDSYFEVVNVLSQNFTAPVDFTHIVDMKYLF